jgi:hypothetical protein
MVLISASLEALEFDDLEPSTANSLPPVVWASLRRHWEELSAYALSAHINPYYLQGDFNGDGHTDTCLLLRERASGKAGILIVDGATELTSVLGAGQHFGNGGDDFAWMDAWYVYPQGLVQRGADERAPPLLEGDALMLIKTEAASAIVYWTGAEYAWYQQGD